jgi:hypothetical protein
MSAWLRSPDGKRLYAKTAVEIDGDLLTGLYMHAVVAQTHPELLLRVSKSSHGEFLHYSALLELFGQALLSSLLPITPVSFSEDILLMRQQYLSHILDATAESGSNTPPPSSSAHGGFQVFANILDELPILVPKSAEDILRWRKAYSEELSEFRLLCDSLSDDLVGKPVDQDQMRLIKERVCRPLERLQREAEADGGSVYLKEFARSEGFWAVAFVACVSTMFGTSMDLAAAIAALGGAASSSVLRARRERNKAIQNSEVGFAFRVQTEQDRRQA